MAEKLRLRQDGQLPRMAKQNHSLSLNRLRQQCNNAVADALEYGKAFLFNAFRWIIEKYQWDKNW